MNWRSALPLLLEKETRMDWRDAFKAQTLTIRQPAVCPLILEGRNTQPQRYRRWLEKHQSAGADNVSSETKYYAPWPSSASLANAVVSMLRRWAQRG